WVCNQAKVLMEQAIAEEAAKIQALKPKLTALGCVENMDSNAWGLHLNCPTYEAFHACEALYPAGESQAENLCWVHAWKADPPLAKKILAELGEKRCRTAGNQITIQCDRPWKQARCTSQDEALP